MLDVPLFLLGLNVNAAPSGGGGGSYAAQAVHFDGNTALYSNALQGGAVSPKGTSFVWYKISSATALFEDSYVLLNASLDQGGGAYPTPPHLGSGFQLYVCDDQFLPSTAGTTPFVFQATDRPEGVPTTNNYSAYVDGPTATDTWQLLAVSWDLTGGHGSRVVQILQNGTLQTATTYFDQGGEVPIDFTNSAALIGALSFTDGALVGGGAGSADGILIGDLSDMFLDITTAVDLSNPATVAKITSGGKPVNQGATGNLLTGSQPLLYLAGDHATYGANKGYGGDFSVYGTLTNATTSPSD